MDEFNKKIDSIIDLLTEQDGGNSVTESDIRDAIAELNELRKFNLLNLSVVSNQLCDCKNFTIKGKMLVCKECGKEHKSLSA